MDAYKFQQGCVFVFSRCAAFSCLSSGGTIQDIRKLSDLILNQLLYSCKEFNYTFIDGLFFFHSSDRVVCSYTLKLDRLSFITRRTKTRQHSLVFLYSSFSNVKQNVFGIYLLIALVYPGLSRGNCCSPREQNPAPANGRATC